jgi:putative ABC transport system substrate-binding protein
VTQRRAFLAGLTLGLAGVPVFAQHPAPRPSVVGVLLQGARSLAADELTDALRDMLFGDGREVIAEERRANGQADAIPGLAAELVSAHVDVIVAVGPAAVEAATRATTTIPIVAFDLSTDPVERGWAASLAHPGGNVTGLFLNLPTIIGKQMELLKEVGPRFQRVAVLWDTSSGAAVLDAANTAARTIGLELQVRRVTSPGDLDTAIRGAARGRADAMAMLTSPLISNQSRQIADIVARLGLPAVSPYRPFAEAGGLLSLGPDLPAFRRGLARYVDRILHGAKSGVLAIEQPNVFELVVNARAAKGLGLTIPPPLLLRANEVLR